MAKILHTVIRVIDLDRSMHFYCDVLNLRESHRLDFPDLALVSLRSEESDFELELTLNKGRTEPSVHGDGYGHVAVVMPAVRAKHEALPRLGYSPDPVKEFKRDDHLFARFFFIEDPNGYKIEVLERHGHCV